MTKEELSILKKGDSLHGYNDVLKLHLIHFIEIKDNHVFFEFESIDSKVIKQKSLHIDIFCKTYHIDDSFALVQKYRSDIKVKYQKIITHKEKIKCIEEEIGRIERELNELTKKHPEYTLL